MKVLVASLSDPSSDPRPARMVDFLLCEGYEVDVLGYTPDKSNGSVKNYFAIARAAGSMASKIARRAVTILVRIIPNIRQFDRLKDSLNDIKIGVYIYRDLLANNKYDLIVVEDLQLLPLAFTLKRDGRVLFDAREYYPLQFNESRKFRIFEKGERIRLCRRYLGKCDAALTVSGGLARQYKQDFNVPMTVYRSVPKRASSMAAHSVGPVITMVHHGVANRNRKIEKMIAIAGACKPRLTLDLFLVGDQRYIAELKNISQQYENVTICEPMEFGEINAVLANYDVGFYILEPTSFNLRYALPNKLFEYIQAGLAVIIGPSPEMAEVVTKYGCGIVLPSFNEDEVSSLLREITSDQIADTKAKARIAAEDLCYESEKQVLIPVLGDLDRRKIEDS